MKKFKIQSFFQKNFFKKNILNKIFSVFIPLFNVPKSTWKIGLNQFKKKNIENYIIEKFQLNYALFALSIVFFLYLLYLSIPGIIMSENIQNELEEKLKKEYNLDFALTPDINYSILPKPHYIVNEIVEYLNLEELEDLNKLINLGDEELIKISESKDNQNLSKVIIKLREFKEKY